MVRMANSASLQALHSNNSKITLIKLPNWHESNHLAIYSRIQGYLVEEMNSGLPRNKSSQWSDRDWNSGPPDGESDALSTPGRPNCLPLSIVMN